MAQDSDVARVTAALKAPGLRYRSFSNEPVRTPRVDVGSVAETFPLFGSSMEEAAEMASPELPDREPVRAALAIPPAPLPEPEPIAAPPVVVVAEPAPPPPPPGKFGVQIAAPRSEAEARATVEAMRVRYPKELAEHWAMISRVELPNGVFYRVLIGPLASEQQAAQLCSSLKAQGAECFIRET